MKLVQNKEMVVTRFLEKLVTQLFPGGELYHFVWDEEHTCTRTALGKLIKCKARALVSFDSTQPIAIKIENFYLNKPHFVQSGMKGWKILLIPYHKINTIKVSHKETGAEIRMDYWGSGYFFCETGTESKFLKEIGLS